MHTLYECMSVCMYVCMCVCVRNLNLNNKYEKRATWDNWVLGMDIDSSRSASAEHNGEGFKKEYRSQDN